MRRPRPPAAPGVDVALGGPVGAAGGGNGGLGHRDGPPEGGRTRRAWRRGLSSRFVAGRIVRRRGVGSTPEQRPRPSQAQQRDADRTGSHARLVAARSSPSSCVGDGERAAEIDVLSLSSSALPGGRLVAARAPAGGCCPSRPECPDRTSGRRSRRAPWPGRHRPSAETPPARPAQGARCRHPMKISPGAQVEVAAGRALAPPGRGKAGPDVGLVRRLVPGEADVAVDPEAAIARGPPRAGSPRPRTAGPARRRGPRAAPSGGARSPACVAETRLDRCWRRDRRGTGWLRSEAGEVSVVGGMVNLGSGRRRRAHPDARAPSRQSAGRVPSAGRTHRPDGDRSA